ncbi:YegJ family protein [Bremerella sp.]|uniref:YegJ family protein n=1 Tax=Bremerella sp. TaxID=2795602 RepID=UPI003918844C
MRIALSFLLLVLLLSGCNSKPETLVEGGYDEQEMEAATAKAQSTVDRFIEALESSEGDSFAVKAPIEDKGQVEHFWVTGVTFDNGQFTGVIGNDPGLVTNVQAGQEWTIAKDDISDWMYMRDGKMHGNYTMRPLLKALPEEEAAQYRAMLAEP